MANEIVGFIQQEAQAAVRRIAIPAAFAFVSAVFFLFAIAALFVSLFFWLDTTVGPVAAAAIVAAIAVVLGLLALSPLAFRRRPKPAPPPNATLPQFVSLLAQTAPTLGPKQAAVAAAALALALGLMARGSKQKK